MKDQLQADRQGLVGLNKHDFTQAVKRSTRAKLVLSVLAVYLLAALFANLLAPTNPYDAAQLDILDAELPPSWLAGGDSRFLLGTDGQGRDLLSAILLGTQLSLLVGLGAVLLQLVLGVVLGLLAGYLGGRVDALLMRLADIQLSFSTLMVAIVVLAVLKSSFDAVLYQQWAALIMVLVIGLAEWPQFARTVRAQVLAERNREYVQAARVMGFSRTRVMFRHLLPNVMTPVLALATVQIANAIIAEASLSFLGLGMPVTQPSLGALISAGFEYIFSGSWWITTLPGLVLIGLILAINLLGDWLQNYLNPRL